MTTSNTDSKESLGRVLLADDDPRNRELLRDLLESNGHTVVEAEDGVVALEKAYSETCDVILLDVMMPRMDGLEACRQLKANPKTAHIPVLMVTAQDEREQRQKGIEAGANDYLVKPVNRREVIIRVRNAIYAKRLHDNVQEGLVKLREQEESLTVTLHSIGDGVLATDAEGNITRLNAVAQRLTGWTEAEAKGRPVGEVFRIINETTRLPAIIPVDDVLQTGVIHFLADHTLLIARDGAEHPIADSAAPIRDTKGRLHGVVLVFRDVSAERRAEQEIHLLNEGLEQRVQERTAELRESEERLNFALLTTRTGAWDLDLLEHTTHRTLLHDRIFGYESLLPSWTYEMFLDHVLPEDRPDVDRTFREATAAQGDWSCECRIRRSDGEVRWIFVAGGHVQNSAGKVVCMKGVVQDITERKQAEAELLKMEMLQSVGILAGGIAHDFNNILQGLYGNISLAMEDLVKSHPSYAFLEEAEKSMARAVRLTKQLLTFAKGGDPVKEAVSLGAMVEEIARFDLTGSNVSLVCHHDEALWLVDADKSQFQQVISNLVINARQAMSKGGKLTITLENADLPDPSVPTLSAGRYVKVTVQDEGDGINPKVIDHIFDPYFTTKKTGNGFGLATVWSVITRHGGHISVVSEPGKGTIFTFYLPASASLLPAETKPPAAESPASPRPAKILVMDDEESVSSLIVRMLTLSGYTVATAPDGQETLALYKQALEAGAPFDAVIMDLTIPGGPGGKEVIQDLLALDPNVQAIVSSGYADDPVMANPARYGFKGVVTKPYTVRTLREAVARVLA